MSIIIPESSLPQELTVNEAVDAAYPSQMEQVAADLKRGLPVLVECDKDLVPFAYINLRNRLRQDGIRCQLLDGRPRPEDEGMMNPGFVGIMLNQLRDAVRGTSNLDRRVVVLPHIDLLTTSQGGLTAEAREVIPLLYENPDLVWLGFKDPSFSIPKVIENLFPRRYEFLGIARDRLARLVTQKESRKFGRQFNPWALYKYVSGMNAARLRKLLSTLDTEDFPEDPRRAYQHIRQATTSGHMEIPSIDLEKQVGGYKKVKDRLRKEILDVLTIKDSKTDETEIRKLEDLIPRGMIFWGPPGTGKTLFAKAMATAIGAAVTVVSGPEMKSKWVGESEQNLRQIFHQARQSAPAIIVFDELDSFASARGTYTGSGVEHSMVNQLLTEMDGFRKEELVFVVGTTNFVESLDPALLRPGRFEFQLQIPYPNSADRREILQIYNKSMKLEMTDETLEFTVKRTAGYVEGSIGGTLYSGDHLNALCRSIARIRLREEKTGPTTPKDVERALTEWTDRPKLTPKEEIVVATHEAGHAVTSMFLEHAEPIDRISIQGDAGALGYVKHQDPAHKYVVTQKKLLDLICTLMGGREAEKLLLDDLSIGSVGDIEHATEIARELVEMCGMGGPEVGQSRTPTKRYPGSSSREFSQEQLSSIDRAVRKLLDEGAERSAAILRENRAVLESLRDLLIQKKVLDTKALADVYKAAGREFPKAIDTTPPATAEGN